MIIMRNMTHNIRLIFLCITLLFAAPVLAETDGVDEMCDNPRAGSKNVCQALAGSTAEAKQKQAAIVNDQITSIDAFGAMIMNCFNIPDISLLLSIAFDMDLCKFLDATGISTGWNAAVDRFEEQANAQMAEWQGKLDQINQDLEEKWGEYGVGASVAISGGASQTTLLDFFSSVEPDFVEDYLGKAWKSGEVDSTISIGVGGFFSTDLGEGEVGHGWEWNAGGKGGGSSTDTPVDLWD